MYVRRAFLAVSLTVGIPLAWSDTSVAAFTCKADTGSTPMIEPLPDGGKQMTEQPNADTTVVSRCDADGRLRSREMTSRLAFSTGTREVLLERTDRDPTAADRYRTMYITYGDVLAGGEGKPRPITNAGPAAEAPAPTGQAAQAADDSCDNTEYNFLSGAKWPAYGYTYLANLARMPHGDADRVEITKGQHSFDYTTNDCGLADTTNFVSRYGGTTTQTPHTYYDGVNVVDFGSLSNLGVTSEAAIAATFNWATSTDITDSDIRFEQPPSDSGQTFSWQTSPQPGAFDIWNTAAHEAGHARGLAHALTSEWLTMNRFSLTNSTRLQTLGLGDVLGLRALYP